MKLPFPAVLLLTLLLGNVWAGCVTLPRLLAPDEGPDVPDVLEPPAAGWDAPAAPGPGAHRYGINATFESTMRIWDLGNESLYASLSEVPTGLRDLYVSSEAWGMETSNATLIRTTQDVVGGERNTMRIAKGLFHWLYDYADYDTAKLQQESGNARGRPDACPPAGGQLQRAGCTYDLRRGICGDLSTLYITMLRIAGVPARPVHGYLDNTGDPTTGGPRIGDFHVWVEVWVGASLHGGDPRLDWMTVDPSGVSGPYDAGEFLMLFGIFNPEHLVLGRDAHYADPDWNSWSSFGWTAPQGVTPTFTSGGTPTETRVQTMDLYFNAESGRRTLVPHGADPPRGFPRYFPEVTVRSLKSMDYGADLSGPAPENATIMVRHPTPDAQGLVLPWQTTAYTLYTRSTTIDHQDGQPYSRLDPVGLAFWEDRFR